MKAETCRGIGFVARAAGKMCLSQNDFSAEGRVTRAPFSEVFDELGSRITRPSDAFETVSRCLPTPIGGDARTRPNQKRGRGVLVCCSRHQSGSRRLSLRRGWCRWLEWHHRQPPVSLNNFQPQPSYFIILKLRICITPRSVSPSFDAGFIK